MRSLLVTIRIPAATTIEMSTFKCYMDICKRGAQYCEDTRERCYWCKDAASHCWTPKMPRQCNQFCNDSLQKLVNQSYSRGYSDGRSSHNGPDDPFIISTSTAVIFALICGLLGLGIYYLRKRLRTSRGDVHDQESPETSPLTQTGGEGGDEVVDMDITEPTDDAVSTNTTVASVDSGLDNRESINSSSIVPCACNRDGGAAEACTRCTELKQLPPRNDAGSLKTAIVCG
ncbi:uncharacterized protein LOC124254650 [Haliotis rubra]|uniref:uncharacterized protein LOC124254650 n=1 Tax=Haliotis rubra TaxID=36100 RepID=UPI001EE62558|nr:uncharacterized protein LOC124254650 [Haliotis rubra]